MNRPVLAIVACVLLPGPLAAYPSFDTPETLAPTAVGAFDPAAPTELSLRPIRWLEDRGSAGLPDDYSDEAYSREEERLRDGE